MRYLTEAICWFKGRHTWQTASPKAGLFECHLCGKHMRIYPNYMCSSRYSEDGGETYKCDKGGAPHKPCTMRNEDCPMYETWMAELTSRRVK